jgi:hypothetical protein
VASIRPAWIREAKRQLIQIILGNGERGECKTDRHPDIVTSVDLFVLSNLVCGHSDTIFPNEQCRPTLQFP